MWQDNEKGTNDGLCGRRCGEDIEWDPTKTMCKSTEMKATDCMLTESKNYWKHFEHCLANIKIFLYTKCMVEMNSVQGWLIPNPHL